MAEELYFTADAALIDRIGRELVGKQETGLLELVKNSYDADATAVKVTFEQDNLTIEDNGTGMNRQELISGFLRLAGDMKIRKPVSERFERRRAGRKGIGRFATQRLGRHLVLSTWKEPNVTGLELSEHDIIAIQIDGLHLDDRLLMIGAVGIDVLGEKHPLGVIEGATENTATVQALLDNLIERGLDPEGCYLFIVDLP